MVYIDIPYVPENNRINKDLAQKELEALDISEDAKYAAFEAIYNRLPRGVSFEGDDLREASLLEKALSRLGIPYRLSEESEYA
ncbi:MAG: hypothetical protein WA584_20075 [Pyrinomonadaceae bacterium]